MTKASLGCGSEFCQGLENISKQVNDTPRFISKAFSDLYKRGFDTPEEIDSETLQLAIVLLKRLTKNSENRFSIQIPFHGYVQVQCTWCNSWLGFDVFRDYNLKHFVWGK